MKWECKAEDFSTLGEVERLEMEAGNLNCREYSLQIYTSQKIKLNELQ